MLSRITPLATSALSHAAGHLTGAAAAQLASGAAVCGAQQLLHWSNSLACSTSSASSSTWSGVDGGGQRGFATNSHDVFNVHRDEPHNNKDTKFDFTPANYKIVSLAMLPVPRQIQLGS